MDTLGATLCLGAIVRRLRQHKAKEHAWLVGGQRGAPKAPEAGHVARAAAESSMALPAVADEPPAHEPPAEDDDLTEVGTSSESETEPDEGPVEDEQPSASDAPLLQGEVDDPVRRLLYVFP